MAGLVNCLLQCVSNFPTSDLKLVLHSDSTDITEDHNLIIYYYRCTSIKQNMMILSMSCIDTGDRRQ